MYCAMQLEFANVIKNNELVILASWVIPKNCVTNQFMDGQPFSQMVVNIIIHSMLSGRPAGRRYHILMIVQILNKLVRKLKTAY